MLINELSHFNPLQRTVTTNSEIKQAEETVKLVKKKRRPTLETTTMTLIVNNIYFIKISSLL